MTPEERAKKITSVDVPTLRCNACNVTTDITDRELLKANIAAAIREAVKEATENLTWNLASCSTFALGYGLDERFNKSKARAAMFDVHNLALKYRTAKAEAYEDAAKIAEMRPTGASDDGMVVQSDIVATIRARAAEVGK